MRTFTAILALPCLTGCLAPSAPLSAIVEVRASSTMAPIANAEIQTTGGNLFIPPRDVVMPPTSPRATPAGDHATTGIDGTAIIELAGNRPNELTVTAAGFPPLHATLRAASASVAGAGVWTEGRPAPGPNPEPRLEVRVRAISGP